jgi:ribosomal protein S12 methylthiotransferase accessory factor
MTAPWQERSAKGHRRGTHRLVAPGATVERVAPLKARMGITRVANVTGLDRIGIPVVMVCRPNARSIAVSQGKGLDLDAARASGLMEAVEGYHAERIELPLKLASLEALQDRHRVVDVAALPAITHGRFRPTLRTLWIEGRDLISETAVWLPYETVHIDCTLPQATGAGCFLAGTNGLASGNHLLEAVTHAICEVVERDSTSLWNDLAARRRDPTRLDLGTVDDEDCVQVIERLEQAGFEVAVWDITSDIGIPSFYCLIVDRRDERAHSGGGAGAHSARDVALLRALTEAVQVRTTYIAGSRDDLRPSDFTPAAIERKLQDARRLMAGPGPGRDFRTIPSHDGESFGDDLTWLLARLRSAGIDQVVAVDLTRADLAIPVVRVVIPGLESPDDHPRYLPGPRVRDARERRP